MRILCIGPLWRGSNAGGLFKALSRKGCMIEVVDEYYFVSLQTKNTVTKVLERVIRTRQEDEFNNNITSKIKVFVPDVILVYKGVFVRPETLKYAQSLGAKAVLFYPDVSMTVHGANIPKCIPLYDLIFTTKTFGIADIKNKYGNNNTTFIPHGFDPEIHRQFPIEDADKTLFSCDASFIGTYSKKKEETLTYLKEGLPSLNLKIWGDQWNKATSPAISSSIQGRSIVGDLYALAIQCSTINLGILSEQVSGASSGDLITSRTFHIPGASGLMFHERNEESVQYFKEDEEAVFFGSNQELKEKVEKYLADAPAREKIRIAGHKKAIKDHSLDARAATIIEKIKGI